MQEWIKVATGAIEVARLERVANVLARAAHPGVVELVSYTPTGLEASELRTALVDGQSLADQALPPEELAGVVAAVATTLADLHDRDIAHGAVSASHILVGAGSGPRLCGFSGDPGAKPADDVAALGALLIAAADPLDRLRAALPQSRVQRWRRAQSTSAAAAARAEEAKRAMPEIARLATDPDPARRPSARAVAAMVRDRVPGARLPGTAGVDLGRRGAERAALVALPVVLLGVGALVAGAVLPSGTTEVAPAPATTTTTTAVASATTEVDGVRIWPVDEEACPSADTPLRADIDGDGCEDGLAFADGVLLSAAARLAVGQAGDVAVTGDWDCDGVPTLVLLRPGNGMVWHFRSWPRAGDAVVGEAVTQRSDAVTAVATRRPADGCDQLDVGLADGTTVTVRMPGSEIDA